MRVLIHSLIFTSLFLSSIALAQTIERESLRFRTPKGFTMVENQDVDRLSVVQFVPNGETRNKYSKTIYASYGNFDDNLQEFSAQMRQRLESECPSSQSQRMVQAKPQSEKYEMFWYYCPLFPLSGKPVFTVAKIIRGRELFVSFQYSFTHRRQTSDFQEAMDFFETTHICDPQKPTTFCQ